MEANFIEHGDRRQTALPAHLHKRSAVTAFSHAAASLTNWSVFIFINLAVDLSRPISVNGACLGQERRRMRTNPINTAMHLHICTDVSAFLVYFIFHRNLCTLHTQLQSLFSASEQFNLTRPKQTGRRDPKMLLNSCFDWLQFLEAKWKCTSVFLSFLGPEVTRLWNVWISSATSLCWMSKCPLEQRFHVLFKNKHHLDSESDLHVR